MTELSRKINALEESQTLLLTARARQLKDSGVSVISFAAGEPDFPSPPHVKEAAIRAIVQDFTKYTPNEGIKELREAISLKLSRENGIHVRPNQVLVSAGAKQSVYNAIQAICNPGDEVVFLSPYWVSYPALVRLADANPVVVPTRRENGYRLEPGRLREAFSKKTKALILNSPCNPTGTVYSEQEMTELVRIIEETGVFVISDEVYEKIIFDGRRHLSPGAFEEIREKVITINGVSKAFAMTGWRIGYMAGSADVVRTAALVQGHMLSCVNSIAQKAAVAAISGPDTKAAAMAKEFERRRNVAVHELRAIPDLGVVLPEGAMFFFLGIGAYLGKSFKGKVLRTSVDLASYLLEEGHVALVPGEAFGEGDALRLSICSPTDELTEGIHRFRQGLLELH
jgi:aspartate aminotransferase